MNQPPVNAPSTSRVPKDAIVVMIVVIAILALIAIYGNVQRWRRDKIEHTIVIPAGSPTPAR
ncbi:MAG TPA: hypothetical protein VE758_04835 [Chthoniobacterales bacterium]|jgi:hypothetical protein|nr:hypothetical protein [Chthoniobacterales bacterium]